MKRTKGLSRPPQLHASLRLVEKHFVPRITIRSTRAKIQTANFPDTWQISSLLRKLFRPLCCEDINPLHPRIIIN